MTQRRSFAPDQQKSAREAVPRAALVAATGAVVAVATAAAAAAGGGLQSSAALAATASLPPASASRSPTLCVTVPATIPGTAFVRDGKTSHYRQGTLLFVTLVEPEKYVSAGSPPGFPWQRPVSSDKPVLAEVPVCRSSGVSTLPVAVYAFRALKPGRATIVAPLRPAWKARQTGLARFFATMIIGPRLTRPFRYSAQIRVEMSAGQQSSIHVGQALDATLTSPDAPTGTRYTVCWSPPPIAGPACRSHPLGAPADHGAPSAPGPTTLRFSVNGKTVLTRRLDVLPALP